MYVAASADAPLATIEAAAAPALELNAGDYVLRPRADGPPAVEVYDLRTRAPLVLAPPDAAGARRFEVPRDAIYVVDVGAAGGAVTVHRQAQLALSPRLIVALASAPLLTLPGVLLLELALLPGPPPVLTIEGRRVQVVTLRRRIAALALDLLVMAGLAMVLVLFTPVFRAIAGLFPLAPFAYVWAASARGQSIGKWLLGIRVLNEHAAAPGPWRGLLRAAAGAAGWATLGVGLGVAVLDPSRRGAHDRFASTVVIED